ncbi:transcription repressor OFP13-like [Magnolia sinica]|uniref:transcription repressor OFP13-like n=1 Tax=Magnolia sinica TaxID=86752 RepID=UPI0026591058|nr:transcription repressor OFP13-like [Magnolia sinica]
MGKPKLRASIKALHQALFSFRQPGSKTMTWVCIQQTKTHSFREVYKSFNSVYSSSSTASTSTDLCSLKDETDRPETARILSASSSRPSAAEESFSASSSLTESDESYRADDDDSVLKTYISSKRFFFSPCTTKSIMGEEDTSAEVKDEMGLAEIGFSDNRWMETGEEREEEEEEERRGECMMLELSFGKDSVTMALASLDPYMDFRVSMEEMVEAHGLREWTCLQELLHCYLSLNDKRTHKVIVLAFVDLLMSLITDEPNNCCNNNNNHSRSYNKERCFPLPLCLDV